MQVESYHYDFNKDVKISSIGQKSKLDQCIDEIIRKDGYKTCNVLKIAKPTNGGSYLGVLYEFDLRGKTETGEKETHIFVKSMPPDAIDLKFLSLDQVYNKELYFYTELTKIFNELQNAAQVPEEDRFKTVKSYDESYPEAIILENVARRGFITWFRMDIVTIDMAETCIKELARFHGLSFVMKKKRPEYFESNIENMETPFIFNECFEEYKAKFCNVALKNLNEDLKIKVGNKLFSVADKYKQYLQDAASKYCLCHGDYRPNNILVRQMDGKITEALPVDYQLIHYGCPILDFLYFMYTGTDYQFRRAHMSDLKDLYFETLDKYLQWFDISVESVLPRKVFEEMYNEKLDYGLIVTMFFVPFILVAEDEVPDVSKELVTDVNFAIDASFKDRLEGAVEELIELGYL